MERLLKENSEFSECLAALSEEKISLKHTISCLERDLQSLKHQEQVDFNKNAKIERQAKHNATDLTNVCM